MAKKGEDSELFQQPNRPGYKDEMNFAEFPLASLSDTVANDVKTLEFTDIIEDRAAGGNRTRTLTVTAADKFGLPTALDDELLLGLIQLTAARGFADRKVRFSRYELIKLLGWRDDSKSYRRVEDSLNRWTGVTLKYVKGWRAFGEKAWVSETFHVLEKATVFDRERVDSRRRMARGSREAGLSSFVWSETVFDSFRAGYPKSLDFDFYKSLTSAVAKRMFRFLDKRFHHAGRWDLDLRSFACEKLGLSKNYSNSELKRKLLPAIRELEAREFLTPLAEPERFRKVRQGNWRVVFARATQKVTVISAHEPDEDPLHRELVARGITPRSARKLLAHHAPSAIMEKVWLFDRMKARGGGIRNRAGWLYSAIVHDYQVPEVTKPAVSLPASVPKQPAVHSPPVAERSTAEVKFEAFWSPLSEEERSAFEADAVAAAPLFLQKQYQEGIGTRGTLWRVTREQILADHFSPQRPGDREKVK